MKIETYECQETASEPLEASEEAINLIEKLGMEGQQKLIAKHSPDGLKQDERCPYRQMKRDEIFVYKTLCPNYIDMKRFSECPIPLRVLQIVAHADSLGIFKSFQVWSAEGAVKDPIVVAQEEKVDYGRINHPYILARWGEELDEWPILVKKAIARWKEQAASALIKIQQRVQNDLDFIAKESTSLETAMKKDEPSYYGFD